MVKEVPAKGLGQGDLGQVVAGGAEAALDIDALVQKAVDGIERVVLTP